MNAHELIGQTVTVGMRYPWDELEIGEAFLVVDKTRENGLRNLASRQRQTSGRRFYVQRHEAGVIVSRVEPTDGSVPLQEVRIVQVID